jgi:malonyl-CoA O-methyltransferase
VNGRDHEHLLLDRRAVARAFDRASASYDAAAALQERVRNELLGRLEELPVKAAAVLDLGAGTGHASRALKRRFSAATVVAVDIAPGMLERARAQSRWLRRFERVRADAYALPFRDHAFDLVFSSLMLQWCDDLDAVFAEMARVLAPGGLLLFSTFGPGTLAELREAWALSDSQRHDAADHVNHFFDPHDLGSALMHAGFAEPVLDVDRVVLRYADTLSLMRELKAIGARNASHGRARGLTSPRRLAAMNEAYERFRSAGTLPATYEVIHATAWGGQRKGREFPRETVISPGAIRRRGQN